MAFALTSDITIGPFVRVMPHEVKVQKSIYEYCDKAIIKVPITARVKRAGAVITQSTETANLIKEGMSVNIHLGYNGHLKKEFTGFVRRVNLTQPCEIECEGYSYQLRIRTYSGTMKKVQLRDVLKKLIPGTGIVLSPQIPDFVIDVLALSNHSGTEVLEMIKVISKDKIRFVFTGNILYAGLIYLDEKGGLTYSTNGIVKYKLGWNVIKDNNLKLRDAKNQDFTLKVVWMEKDGTQKEFVKKNRNIVGGSATAGNTGETKVVVIKQVTDEKTMQGLANAMHNSVAYTGYEGKITAFLQPYCEPGFKAIIKDDKYPERSGSYLVESTEVTYGMQGARRIVGIGLKL